MAWLFSIFVCKSLLEYLLCYKVFTSGGTSFRILFKVPTSVVFFFRSCVARLIEVKRLLVVTFLPLPKYGSTNFITTLSDNLCVAGLVSSLPRYGMAFRIYLDSKSTAIQNLIQNLSGLFAIYCVNLQRALVGNNCSSTVIFFPCLWQTIQFSTNLSQTAEIKENLFV